MDTSSELLRTILQHLSDRHGSALSLEELTILAGPISNFSAAAGSISTGRNGQSIILDALFVLHDQGCIFLDPMTDCSRITLKGLIKTGSKRAAISFRSQNPKV